MVFANLISTTTVLQAGALAGNPTELSPHDPVAQLEQTRNLSLRRSAAALATWTGASCRPFPAPRQKRKRSNARCLGASFSILGVRPARAGTVWAGPRADHLHLATHSSSVQREPGGSGRTAPFQQARVSPCLTLQPRSALAPWDLEHGPVDQDSRARARPSARRPAPWSARPWFSPGQLTVEPDQTPLRWLGTALGFRTLRLSGTKLRRTRRLRKPPAVIYSKARPPDCATPSWSPGPESVIATSMAGQRWRDPAADEPVLRSPARGTARSDALRPSSHPRPARHAHPFYWAGFILLGQDGPISGITRTEGSPLSKFSGSSPARQQ